MSFFNNDGKDCPTLQFLRESTVHGVKYLGQRERPYLERICWICILLTAAAASAFFILGIIKKYDRNPVIVSFQPSQTSVIDVPFAAVTVCSLNRFKKSVITGIFADAQSENNVKRERAHLVLRQLDHICSLSNTFSNFFNYTINETRVNACARFGVGCGNVSHDGFLMDFKFPVEAQIKLLTAFPTCQDIMPLCLWEGQKQDCSEIFQQIVTDMGICCTFNAAPRMTVIKDAVNLPGSFLDEDATQFWKAFNIDDLLESDSSKNGKYDKYLKFQSKAGQGSGLSLLINTDMDEYFCDNHDSYGVRIHTHSPIEIPHVAEFGVAVGPNVEMFVSLQADITKSDKEIRSLSVNRRKCYYSHEEPLDSFNFYTKSNCLDQCLGEEIGKLCNCVRMDMGLKFKKPSLKNVTYCEGIGFDCAKRVMIKVSKLGTDRVCPQCKPSCNKIEYFAQLSSLPLRNNFNITVQQSEEEEGNGPSNFVRKNASIVHIFFGSDNVYSRIRKNLYSFNDLFAHVGGILGLFLGMSVVSVVEPVNILFRKFLGSEGDKQSMQKQPVVEENPHFYAKSPTPVANYNSRIIGDPWRKECSTFMLPNSRVYPFGYDLHQYKSGPYISKAL